MHSFQRVGQSFPVVKNLIIVNALLLFATFALNFRMDIDLYDYLALYYYKSEMFRPHQFVTHMFMHGDIFHLFFNMFALYMFGKALEMVWGSKRFLIYYFVTGLGAAFLHLLVTHIQFYGLIQAADVFAQAPSPELFITFVKEYIPNPKPEVYEFATQWSAASDGRLYAQEAISLVNNVIDAKINVPTVGASGAVFGVLLAFGMLFPNTELMLLFPPIPIKAKYFVMGYGAIELYLGLTQPGSNIAHFAHLGGMIFGFFLIRYWARNGKSFY